MKREFSLISAANSAHRLLQPNLVRSYEEFLSFDEIKNGLPLLVDANSCVFDYSDDDVFEIPIDVLSRKIYGFTDENYIGFRHAFNGNKFLKAFSVKKDFHKEFGRILSSMDVSVRKINALITRFKRVGAFQTRNIPHSGHEAIISRMLEECDHVVINPVTGPKKSGDISEDTLNKAFEFLGSAVFDNRVSFIPLYANMYYAGPLEALHHCYLRQRLGFYLFSIGRDHAGAEKRYSEAAAVNFVRSHGNLLSMKLLLHNGAVFCPSCQSVTFRGECGHDDEELIDISGSDFRNALRQRVSYKYANRELQYYLHEFECLD